MSGGGGGVGMGGSIGGAPQLAARTGPLYPPVAVTDREGNASFINGLYQYVYRILFHDYRIRNSILEFLITDSRDCFC